jgi:predicted signal transduction protein with EAL and GGDEF domain
MSSLRVGLMSEEDWEIPLLNGTNSVLGCHRELLLLMGSVATEGVETAEQSEALRSEGCHQLQSYHIGRPMPAHKIPSVIADFERRQPPSLRVVTA